MDGDGNRTSYGSTAPSGNCVGAIAVTGSTTGMYSYNRDDTIASGPPGGNICAANTSYSYDSDGRLTFDGDNTYSYDGFDNTTGISTLQLSCAKVALASTTYTYDGLGRQATSVSSLVSGTDTMGDDGLSSALLTETQGGLLNLGLLSTMIDYPRDANGSPLAVADNSVTGSGHGTGSGAVTQYISDDGNGSVGTVSTTAGGLACVLRYTPYGTQLTSDGCTSTPNKYQGTLSYTSAHTDETGDFQDGTRFYNPALDAYTTPDRYGPSATNADRSVGIDPLTADTYNYVNGDPINLTDFTGHSWYNPVDDYHTVVSHVEQYSGDAYDAVTGAGGDVLGYLFDLPSQIASGLDKVGAAITSGAKAVTHAAKTVATTAIKVGITSNEVVADLAGGILAGATNTLVSVGTLGAVHTHLSLCAFGGGAIGTACTVGRYTGDALAYAGLAVATGGAGEAAEAAEAGELAAEGTEASLAAEDSGGIPSRLARVTEAKFAGSPSLGPPGSDRVFVTAAEDIEGITTSQGIAERLTLLDDAGKLREGPFSVSTFDTPEEGLGTPVFRTNPGFVQGGLTQGGAREFDLPNMLYEDLGNVQQGIVP
jgi:RHS repeat-associated protein